MIDSGLRRATDFFSAFVLLVLLSPLLASTALAIRLAMGSPVMFRQLRIGFNEEAFELLKFRTMHDSKDANGNSLPDVERVSRLGAFLRRTSIDELPQLFNILKGQMALVGPRPLFVRYLPYYTQRERLRHTVRPGITGLAQTSGRNRLLWDERLELDVVYVERRSLWLDLRILARTFMGLLRRGDVLVVPGLAQGPLDRYRKASKELPPLETLR